jgi:hypothetical protein
VVNGGWTDFITDFMEYTEGTFSPEIFRRWSGIALVAGALERRVWLKMGSRITFPNLYIMLVADPGVGKYVIEMVKELWESACEPGTQLPVFNVAPDNTTKASLIDEIARAKNIGLRANAPPGLLYHSLLVAAEELAVFMPQYDNDFIGVLNSIYNNKPHYKETRRASKVKEVFIQYPQLNLLIGAQPGLLAESFPETAWSTGLTARIIMVFGSEMQPKDLFEDEGQPDHLRGNLLLKLGQISQLYGQMQWVPEAAQAVGDWHLAGGPPTPTHSKLVHYNRRRTSLHMPKLALVSAISRTGKLVVEPQDVERAKAWLIEAEALMPDIFRAMVGKSDFQVLEELHYFVTQAWSKDKTKLVHERLLWQFLQQRVPTYLIPKLLESAERSHYVKREANSVFYKPLPKFTAGLE